MALENVNDIILGLRKDKGREIIIIAITRSFYAKMLLIREFGKSKGVFFLLRVVLLLLSLFFYQEKNLFDQIYGTLVLRVSFMAFNFE